MSVTARARYLCFLVVACNSGTSTNPDAGDSAVPANDVPRTDTANTDVRADAPSSCCAAQAAWLASSAVLPQLSCPPWTLTDDAETDPQFDGGPLVIATASMAERISYAQSGEDLEAATSVVIRFRMQFVAGSALTTARGGAGVIFAFGSARMKGSVFFDDGHVFLSASENARGDTATVATTDAMHDYELAVNITAGTMSLARDGAPILTGTLYANPEAATDFIVWGEGSIAAQGRSLWASFSHDAYRGCE